MKRKPALLFTVPAMLFVSSLAFTGMATAEPAQQGTSTSPQVTDASQAGSNPWLDRRVLNIAHQGGEIEAPSDTLFALKTAQQKGADVLEIDVHATADGEIILMHDNTVDRTTNGSGRIDELTLEEIQTLDAAHWFVPDCGTCPDEPEEAYEYRGFATGEKPIPPELGEFEPSDFGVPTLREVLETFPDELINIEIKATEPDTTPYEQALAELLLEFGRSTDTIVVSFNDGAVDRFKEHAPDVSTAPGAGRIAEFWVASQGELPGMALPGMHALQVPTEQDGITIVTEDFVSDAHNNDLAVHVWTIDEREEMERLVELGVDGIMTNRPTLLEDVLEETNAQQP